MKYPNPFVYLNGTKTTTEKSVSVLYKWLLVYGFNPTPARELLSSEYSTCLTWDTCRRMGILKYEWIGQTTYIQLTPKVLEVLEKYDGKD